MGKHHRAIINEYGLEIYDDWRKSRKPWPEYEKALYIPVEGLLSITYKEYFDGSRY